MTDTINQNPADDQQPTLEEAKQFNETLNNAPFEEVEVPAEGSLLEQPQDAQKLYGYVKEVVDLFRSRVESGELSQFQVSEILSVAVTGSIYSTVPPQYAQRIEAESDALLNYMWKQYEGRVKKKKYMFASQLIGPARFASYLVSRAAGMLDEVKAKVKAAEDAKAAASAESAATTE